MILSVKIPQVIKVYYDVDIFNICFIRAILAQRLFDTK